MLGAARLRLDGWGAAVAAIEAALGGAAKTAEADDEETEKEEEADIDDNDNGDAVAGSGASALMVALPLVPGGDHGESTSVGALRGIMRPLQADAALR